MSTTFGEPRRHFRICDSTNERARELAKAGAASGTVVTAGEQTEGRGRHGRRWSAPAGTALLYSAILRPLEAEHALLPLAVPLAVCEAIESLASAECMVKWPNDVWVDERKVAGVLIEARPPGWAVIGVGVNVSVPQDAFPADLRWPATSVGDGLEPDDAMRALNAALSKWVGAANGDVIGEFRRRDALSGREVSWEGAGPPGAGIAGGIDAQGNLLVRSADGAERALGAGEVTLRLS